MRLFYTKSVDIYRLNSVLGKESYSKNGTIKGYLAPITAKEMFLTEGNPSQSYKLIADLSADIKRTDRVAYNGDNYLVTGVQRYDFGVTRRTEALLELLNS
jgi:hypothetical protein